MPYVEPSEPTTRRTLIRWFGVAAFVAVAVVGVFFDGTPTAPVTGATRASPAASDRSASEAATAGPGSWSSPGAVAAPPPRLPDAARSPLGVADGAVPDDTTVFDGSVAGVANLDSDLLGAVRRAAADAARDGVGFVVDSGWRSPEYQEHLRQEAVAKYGSEAEAARWVASAERSAHVSGDAIDLGPNDATRWLAARGAAYDLCQIYANEPWHYELRAGASTAGCPAMYADPTHDPRLRP